MADYLYIVIVVCVLTSFVLQGWLLARYRRQHREALMYDSTQPWAWLALTKAGDVIVRYFGGGLMLAFATIVRNPGWMIEGMPVLEASIAVFAVLMVSQTARNVRAERRSARQSRKEVSRI